LPTQHPVGHEVASHTQLPPVQRWPAPHAFAFAPQTHAPADEQRSLLVASHVAQLPPLTPHLLIESGTQLFPSQHPVGHEVASHTQAPPRHIWPAAQAGAAPQVQAPLEEHPSAWTASQPPQSAPPVPHVASMRGLQVTPEQHPFGQVALVQLLHRPPVHDSPEGQASHALPPPPHELGRSPARHAPAALQQPLGQEVASQTQVLPTQRWPTVQVGPVPHRQVPLDEQLSERTSHAAQVAPAEPQVVSDRVVQVAPSQQPPGHDVSSQMQRPAAQVCPGAHGAPVPHTQAPAAEQALAIFGSHVVHNAPADPQAARVRGWHTPAAQHPSGHEDASHVRGTPSIWHRAEHPSPAIVLPSSQASMGALTMWSPQIAGAPSVISTATSCFPTTATGCWLLAAITSPASPSTRSVIVVPTAEAGKRITADSVPVADSARAGAGRVPGANAGALPAQPENVSAVSPPAGS
jgi:hypothetical protein